MSFNDTQQPNAGRLDQLRNELPTHESVSGTDFKPTHGGAGSLPGGREETGVATLPDERLGAIPTQQAGRGGYNFDANNNNNNNNTGTNIGNHLAGTNLKPTHGGAGIQPGGRDESGVATLPGERLGGTQELGRGAYNFDTNNNNNDTSTNAGNNLAGSNLKPTHGGAGIQPSGRDDSGVATLPGERLGGTQQLGRGGYNFDTSNNNNNALNNTGNNNNLGSNAPLGNTVPGTAQPVGTGATYETSGRAQEISGQGEHAHERVPGTYGFDPNNQNNQQDNQPSRVEQTEGDAGHDKPSLGQKIKQGVKEMTSGLKK